MNCLETKVCASFPSQPDVSDNSFDFNVNKVHATCFFFVLYKREKKKAQKRKHHLENHLGCIGLWNVTLTLKSYIGTKEKGTSVKQTAGRGMKKKREKK